MTVAACCDVSAEGCDMDTATWSRPREASTLLKASSPLFDRAIIQIAMTYEAVLPKS